MQLTKSFLRAGIPLRKISHPSMQQFITEFTSFSASSEPALRKIYVPNLYQECLQKLREKAADNFIWVALDETTDIETTQKLLQFDDGYVVEGVIYHVLHGIRIPFKAWYDSINKRSRIDYNNGGAETYQLSVNRTSTYYKITAAYSSLKKDYKSKECFSGFPIGRISFQPVLPDPSKFTFAGLETFKYMPCHLYTYNFTSSKSVLQFGKLWIRYDKEWVVPVRYEVKAYHYGDDPYLVRYYLLDHYYLDYSYYMENSCIGDDIFKIEPALKNRCVRDNALFRLNPISLYFYPTVLKGDESFVNEWQKSYEGEAEYRMEVYRKNLLYIDSVNRAGLSYKLGVNQFSDRTEEELKAMFGQESTEFNLSGAKMCPESTTDDWSDNYLPDQFNWRKYGAVSPVRYVLHCYGADAYFSIVDSVEGAYFIHNKMRKFVRLSPQAVMDCSWEANTTTKNSGCYRGDRRASLEWIRGMKGIPLDEDYRPYTGVEGFCDVKENVTKLVAPIKDICQVSNNATALRKALFKHGPISTKIFVDSKSFSFYSNGIYDCKGTLTTIRGLIIGYGSFKGDPYWLFKYIFGTDWGIGGYAMISAAADDPCKVLGSPYYVTF